MRSERPSVQWTPHNRASLSCAANPGPIGPKGQPDPTVVQAVPRRISFLWSFAALALLPAKLETPLLIVGQSSPSGC